jgi:peptide deformylase
MAEIMFEAQGVGLAAPQVGLSVRLFIASPTFSPDDLHVYVNPRITGGDGVQNEEEGCLSFPGIYNRVKRKQIVTVEATDLDGNTFVETCRDLGARIIQHEMDHLDGVTLIDRMGTIARLTNRNLFRELEEQFQA